MHNVSLKRDIQEDRNLIKKKEKKIRHPDIRKKKFRAKVNSTRKEEKERKKKNTIREYVLGKKTEEERMDQVAADDAVRKRLDENPRKSEVGGRCQAKKEDTSRVEKAPPDFQSRPKSPSSLPTFVFFPLSFLPSWRPPLLGRNFSRTISFARASRSIVTSH